MQPGDRIVRINNQNIHVYREVSIYKQMHQGETATVTYERDGERHTVVLEPKQDENGEWLLGFLGSGVRTRGNVFQTIYYSAYEVKFWITTTLQSLGMLIGGQVGADESPALWESSAPSGRPTRPAGRTGLLRLAEHAESLDSPVGQPGRHEPSAPSGPGRRPSGIPLPGGHPAGQAGGSGEGGHGTFRGPDAPDGTDGVRHVQ